MNVATLLKRLKEPMIIRENKFIKSLKSLAPMALKNSTIKPKVGIFLGNLLNCVLTEKRNMIIT